MSDRRGLVLDIAKSNSISENEDGSFSVPSQARKGLFYTVKVMADEWTCTCPDFVNRVGEIDLCKHIYAVKFWIAVRVELQEQPKPKVFAEDALQCAKCGSIKVIRFGVKRGKQAFKCNDCGHRFTEQKLLRGSRYSLEMVSLTLDLYFSGTSLRKATRILNNHFGTRMGSSTIYRWIQRFVPQISEYVNGLTPELSDTWHADELFVKMKGGVQVKGGQKNMAFLWNVMDRRTRFLLASKLSKARDVGGATRAFMEAKKNAHDSQPERIFTDAAIAYPEGIAFAFGNKKPDLIAKAGIKKPAATNNRIERLNGTLRERVKVQRGWKNPASKIAEGQRIHYNFVKPHAALEGQTPAERAGIGIEGQNTWLALLKKSVKP